MVKNFQLYNKTGYFLELTWAVVQKLGLSYVQRTEVTITKLLHCCITCHYCRLTVSGERFRPVMHDGLIVVFNTQTVNFAVTVFIKSKLKL